MNRLTTAAAPYLFWIAIAVLLATSLGSAWVGSRVQKAHESGARAALAAKVAKKDVAIGNAAAALRAAGAAIREINAEADRRIKAAKELNAAFADAANAATEARKAAEKRLDDEREVWRRARRNEACRLLLDTDIVATCGVPL